MKTLKFGNGTWATKKGSTLAYNDEGGNFKPLPFTYTGAGKGTRVNKEGLIEVVENDKPRIDYKDSEDGAFLLEKASTNLIQYSEDFGNSYWSKSGSSITSNVAISPDGTLNADKLVENTNLGTHWFRRSTTVSNGKITFSIFAKKGERDYLLLRENTLGGIYFDLTNGTIGGVYSNTPDEYEINKFKDGWYRCSVTFTVSNSTADFLVYTANIDNSNNYQGDGTSGVYIYGAMLEENSVASSYIPTQGTIQTRVAETANGSGNSEVFNDSEGVLFANIAANANDGTYRFLSVSAGAYANSIRIGYFTTPNVIEFRVVSGGTPQTQPLNTLSNTTIPTKIAGKYKQNDFALWVNGFEVDADANGNTPSGLSELAFDDGNSSNNSPFYGKTKEIAYYDTVLTDLELETLTSYRTWEAMVKELNLNIIHNE